MSKKKALLFASFGATIGYLGYKASKKGNSQSREMSNIEDYRKSHVLIVSQYFYPEQFRVNDICSELVKRGHKVTVLTGIPNYPDGDFFEGYKFRYKTEQWNGATIIRLPITPRKHGSVLLSINFLSFVVSGFFWSHFTKLKADYVFFHEVSPMTQGLVAGWYAKRRGIPYYLYVTDLWPENVEIITGIHNKLFIGGIQKMVDHIYNQCDHIFTSSRSFIHKVVARGVDESKVSFWPQYAEDFYRPAQKPEDSREIPQDGKLNLTFAGNLGEAQGLDVLVKAAVILKKQEQKVRFNVIGSGRYEDTLKQNIRAEGVNDLFNFIPRKPAAEIPLYLALSDVALVTLSKSEVFAMTIPAKIQSSMVCGIPIIVAADGEVQEIIKESACGFCGDAGDGRALAENIIALSKLTESEREKMSENAKAYYKVNYDKTMLIDELEEYL